MTLIGAKASGSKIFQFVSLFPVNHVSTVLLPSFVYTSNTISLYRVTEMAVSPNHQRAEICMVSHVVTSESHCTLKPSLRCRQNSEVGLYLQVNLTIDVKYEFFAVSVKSSFRI